MHSSIVLLGAAATLLDTAAAHGFVTGIQAKSGWTPGSDPVWWYYPADSKPKTAGWDALNQDIGFVEPANAGTSDVNCHKSATAGQLYASVEAGETIEIPWYTWPDSHKGPIINYIAPCGADCTTLAPSSLRWTKISQAAVITPGYWVTDELIKTNFTSTLTIPAKLAPGNYVLRHEIIALHSAYNDNGAQLYPQCLNLKISGSGNVTVPAGVAGTSLYNRADAGLIFNIYSNPPTYPFPGPEVWTGAD